MIQLTKGPIARGTIRTSFVLGLRLIVQAGTLLIVARMLGPHEFGAFAGVAALAVILGTLSTFGTPQVLMSVVSRDARRRGDVLCYAVPNTLLYGLVSLVIFLVVCTFVLHTHGVGFGALLAIGGAETVLQPLFQLPSTEQLALGRIARSQLLTTLPMVLRLGAAAAVFLLHVADPLIAYCYGYFAASLLGLVVALVTMPAPWPVLKLWRLPTASELREAAGYAAINLTGVSPAELDKTLAVKLLPLAASGVYAAGARVINAAALPVVAMILSALPRLFREGREKRERTQRLLLWIFGATLGYSATLMVVLWLAAPAFVWVFGAKYQGIERTIHWLCLALPGLALRSVAGSVLMAFGEPWMRVGFEVTGLVVLTTAALMLTAHFGATGMPIALICSEWVMTIMGIAMIYRSLAPSRRT